MKKLRGIVRGRTVELETDPGIPDGQELLVVVESADDMPKRQGILRLEGALADCPEWDEIMEEIYLERKGILLRR